MTNDLLYSVALRLTAEADAAVSSGQGHHALAALLGLLRASKPEIAERIHALDGPKPFTISPLLGGRAFAPVRETVKEGKAYWLRLSFLEDEVFCHFLDAMSKEEKLRLNLGAASFQVAQVDTRPALKSGWVNCATFDQLLASASVERRLGLQFCSPTVFRSKGRRNVLFPEPGLVFASLLSRWNTFSPTKMGPHIMGMPDTNVLTARYRLETRMLSFGSYQEAGFAGQCWYLISEGVPEDVVLALNALADFAFYGGTGAKTTMGMGQTRRISDARSLPDRAGGHPA